MMDTILYPLLAQGLLIFIVTGVLMRRRLKAYAAGETKGEYFKLLTGGEGEPPHVVVAQRSFLNQFELPVLFFVVCLAAQVFGKAGSVMIALAWAYVALRAVHTYIHLTSNAVLWRFRVFALSTLVLVSMWINLAL